MARCAMELHLNWSITSVGIKSISEIRFLIDGGQVTIELRQN